MDKNHINAKRKRRKPRRCHEKHNHDEHHINEGSHELPSTSNSCYSQHNRDGHQSRGEHSRNKRARTNVSSQRSSSSQPDEDDNIEIPGFYYDKEKKKYFKILPNHNSSTAGSITEEIIKKIAVEKKRQKDLITLLKPTNRNFELLGNKPTCLRSLNCCHLMLGCSMGLRSPISMMAAFRKQLAQGLVPRAKMDIAQTVPGELSMNLDNLEDPRHLILSKDSTSLIGVWSLKQFIRQRLQQIDLNPAERIDDVGNVRLRTRASDKVHGFNIQKVTSLCWAPRPEEAQNTSRILFTTSSVLGSGDNMARLCDLSNERESYSQDNFSIGPSATWASVWSQKGSQFCVGTEDCSMLIDVATRRLWELYSGNCAVFALSISQQTGQTMYSGTRRGYIYTHDLRSRSTRPVSHMSHRSSVSHIYLSHSECSLTASDVSGKIKNWDLRQRKVIKEYPGHVGQYVRQPFHVDTAENLLFAVGQDCYTRIWCFQTGQLLHTIPSPYPVSVESIPLIAYSHSMGGPGGLPGILMACKGEFHFYSM